MTYARRRQVKNAFLRAPLPFKGPIVGAAWRGYEYYVSRRGGDAAPGVVDGLPVPPARLRVLVAGVADRDRFLETGRAHVGYLREVLEDAGHPIEEMHRILDFGCGCGRMLRWWADLPATDVHGCDYSRELAAWCAANLPFAEVRVNALSPPLSYEDRSFELLYALSIFTHLTPDLAAGWLAEMHRVLEPGGLLWFTAHGESLSDRLSPAERADFEAGEAVVHFPEIEGMNLCSMFWPRAAVARMLGDRFEIVSSFDPLADPATAARACMTHDAYLVCRL